MARRRHALSSLFGKSMIQEWSCRGRKPSESSLIRKSFGPLQAREKEPFAHGVFVVPSTPLAGDIVMIHSKDVVDSGQYFASHFAQ